MHPVSSRFLPAAFLVCTSLLLGGCAASMGQDGGPDSLMDERRPDGARPLAVVTDAGVVRTDAAGVVRSDGAAGPVTMMMPLPAIGCPAGPPIAAPSGRTYHVCDCGTGAAPSCQPGADTADGLTAATAWRSYERARAQFATMAAGDNIAFCRGGSFTMGANRRWSNAACRADRRCVVRDYAPAWGAGTEGRPVLLDPTGGHAFALDDPANADHEEGYVFANLELRGRGMGSGFFLYNDVDDVLIDGMVIDGFSVGVFAGESNPPAAGSDGRNARIVVRNSELRNNVEQGYLGASDDSAIECNVFSNNGAGRAVFNHNLYVSAERPVTNVRVRGNQLSRSAMVGGKCQGVSLVAHGNVDGLLIEGNVVREEVGAAAGGCWGIAVDSGWETPEQFKRVVVRGNRVINVGNVGIGLNACQDCLVENNVVVHEQPFATTAIAIPDRERASNDGMLQAVVVRNNSVLATARSGGGVGVSLGGEGMGHVVTSNAVLYMGSSTFSCFAVGSPANAYAAVDHNVCGAPNAPAATWNQARSLQVWQSQSSLDRRSRMTDPKFSAPTPPAYDLTPAADSPLIGGGSPTHSAATDIAGKTRGAAPDVGAYQR